MEIKYNYQKIQSYASILNTLTQGLETTLILGIKNTDSFQDFLKQASVQLLQIDRYILKLKSELHLQ